jgi:hypothetical protein
MMHVLFCAHAYECDAQAEEERELARLEERHCEAGVRWRFQG